MNRDFRYLCISIFDGNKRILIMQLYPPTVIWRHRRENLRKCSLRGLEGREDICFYTYPKERLPDLSGYILLAIDAPPLTEEDSGRGLFLLDATWRYAETMMKQVDSASLMEKRSIPSHFRTAYPRRQEDCFDPERGLASVEALYIAYYLMGRDAAGLLEHYHWKERFLEMNFNV